MCGINGIITSLKTIDTKSIVGIMNDEIDHRGPDDSGIYIKNLDEISIALGMRRLSIIDLSTGHQPISNDDKSITIVFNGEIYNYQEIADYIISKGVKLLTKSDTETILRLYELEGEESFAKLDGMFAFSIYDFNKGKVFIARDYFGEKPLYYYKTQNSFYWASELKSILKVIDRKPNISKDALNLYFQLTYIPSPFSIYEDIFKLQPNSYIVYNLEDKTYDLFEIHKSTELQQRENIKYEEAKKQVKNKVFKSVISRSISDVPLGTFLSGGVDSSIVSWCLAQKTSKPIDTFSIGFEKKAFDERDKSKVIANLISSNHHEFILNESDLENDINRILLNFDEPFADQSALPSYLVANRTKKFVKVVLTGDGGDEVFGGYNNYLLGGLNNMYTIFVPKLLHNKINLISDNLLKDKNDFRGIKFKLRRLLKGISYDDNYYYSIISLAFQQNEIKELLSVSNSELSIKKILKLNHLGPINNLSAYRNIDKIISLEGDMLVKVDRTSMLNSLEARAPFLNKDLWDYSFSLPESYLLDGRNKKKILKEAFQDEFPKGFLEKSKKGFNVPVGDWLRNSLKNELLKYSEKKFILSQGIFNVNTVTKLVDDHVNGRFDNSYRVWSFYVFQKWYFNTYLKIN